MGNGYIGAAPLPKAAESEYTKELTEASNTVYVPGGYTEGGIHIYVNGLYIPDTEYTASDGMNVVFPSVMPVGTIVSVRSIASFQVANLSAANNSLIAILSSNLFLKEDSRKPLFSKTTNTTLSTNQRLVCSVAGNALSIPSGSVVQMPTLTAGEDYAVYLEPSGLLKAVKDAYNAPSVPTAPNAIKIGGFHYGLVTPGTTPASGGFNNVTGVTASGGSMLWTQTDVDKIAGINSFTIWDNAFRCAGEQRGMAFDPISQCWVAIYLMSTDSDANGPSRYNTDVASGTVLPKIPAAWGGNGTLAYAALRSWEANEMVTAYGLRLIRYEEFVSAAFGVTEGQSLGGSSVTIPATARQPNYTSRIGLEQATGNAWIIGGPINSSNGTAWAGNGRGSWFGTTGLVVLGGARDNAANSGSRAANFNVALSNSLWYVSVRAAGDHINTGDRL